MQRLWKLKVTYSIFTLFDQTKPHVLFFKLSQFQNSLAITNDIIFIYDVMIADRSKTPWAKNFDDAEVS